MPRQKAQSRRICHDFAFAPHILPRENVLGVVKGAPSGYYPDKGCTKEGRLEFMTHTIVPHLWFDKEAKEAALFYAGLFHNSRILDTVALEDTPSGNAESVRFVLAGQPFQAISAGPEFRFNSSISLMAVSNTVEEVDRLYQALIAGGSELMALGEYPFSPRYAWIRDRYGLNWQLIQLDAREETDIRPTLMFASDACGKAEEAADFLPTCSRSPPSAMSAAMRRASWSMRSRKSPIWISNWGAGLSAPWITPWSRATRSTKRFH